MLAPASCPRRLTWLEGEDEDGLWQVVPLVDCPVLIGLLSSVVAAGAIEVTAGDVVQPAKAAVTQVRVARRGRTLSSVREEHSRTPLSLALRAMAASGEDRCSRAGRRAPLTKAD